MKMESPRCEQRIIKVSLAEILRCFEHPISEEQAWAICFQCCRKMEQLAMGLYPPLHSVFIKGPGSIFIHADGTASFKVYHKSGKSIGSCGCQGLFLYQAGKGGKVGIFFFLAFFFPPSPLSVCYRKVMLLPVLPWKGL